MNCEELEELLVDFIEGEINPHHMELVKNHLAACQRCSVKMEQYNEIRNAVKEDAALKPSPGVLTGLSRLAAESLDRGNASFWRRFYYSPVLVPAAGVVLAVFVWFNLGHQVREYPPAGSVYSRDVMAKKTKLKEELDYPAALERKVDDLETGSERVSPGKPDSLLMRDVGEGSAGREADVISRRSDGPGEMIAATKVQEADRYSEERVGVSAEFHAKSMNLPRREQQAPQEPEYSASPAMPEAVSEQATAQASKEHDEAISEAGSEPFGGIDYSDRLNLAIKQQRDGDCEASVRTNEELLNLQPPPTEPVKEKAYLSLGECYEKMGEWGKALSNYRNLQRISPEQTAFAAKKIEYIRRQAGF